MDHLIKCIFVGYVFVSSVIGCTTATFRVLDFVEDSSTESYISPLLCARKLIQNNGTGCRMNVNSKLIHSIEPRFWCRNRTLIADNVFLETKTAKVIPKFRIVSNLEWMFPFRIPVCMNEGSVIAVQFTPRTGWSRIVIVLLNEDLDKPMRIGIRRGETSVSFKSTVNETIINQQTLNEFPFLTDTTSLLEIKVQEHSYKIYHNGDFYYEFTAPGADTSPVSVRITMFKVESDVHYLQYKMSESP